LPFQCQIVRYSQDMLHNPNTTSQHSHPQHHPRPPPAHLLHHRRLLHLPPRQPLPRRSLRPRLHNNLPLLPPPAPHLPPQQHLPCLPSAHPVSPPPLLRLLRLRIDDPSRFDISAPKAPDSVTTREHDDEWEGYLAAKSGAAGGPGEYEDFRS